MPGWDVQILDEDEHPVAPGERGEICLRARSNPHYPLGYWNNPEASARDVRRRVVPHQGRRPQDEDGYFWYDGRADDVIISAGYRIGPFEVESACIEHPAVREAAASPRPTSCAGTSSRRSSCWRTATRAATSSPSEIEALVRERLSRYAYPRRVEFVSELPKTLTGKIRRIELRQAESERARV